MGRRDPRLRAAGALPKAVEVLDDDDLSMLAAWHASLEVGQPIANKEFLLKAFAHLGEHRREALRIAAGFRGEDAFEAGSARSRRWTPCCPGCPRSAPRSWRRKPSSSTAGTDWAARTEGRAARLAASSPTRVRTHTSSTASLPATLRVNSVPSAAERTSNTPGLGSAGVHRITSSWPRIAVVVVVDRRPLGQRAA